jgi:5'-3' exonuclease
MKIHLIDGTYELFRHHFGAPPRKAPDGQEVGATLGLIKSMMALLAQPDVTHVAVAFDHVIESFRNDLFSGYKSGAGVDPTLIAQFSMAEDAVSALGLVVWSMVEFEADDALASAAAKFKNQAEVEQIIIGSPDKDLAQLVSGSRIVCWDRRRNIVLDEAAVRDKFGVSPQSIPDWLALVGDAADGIPGIPGWGAKSAATVLSRYEHFESIPDNPLNWGLSAGRAVHLAESLARGKDAVMLYRQLATLREDVPLQENLTDLEWRGAHTHLKDICSRLGDEQIPIRVSRWRD